MISNGVAQLVRPAVSGCLDNRQRRDCGNRTGIVIRICYICASWRCAFGSSGVGEAARVDVCLRQGISCCKGSAVAGAHQEAGDRSARYGDFGICHNYVSQIDVAAVGDGKAIADDVTYTCSAIASESQTAGLYECDLRVL